MNIQARKGVKVKGTGSDSAEDATEMEMGEFQVRGRVA